MVIQLFQKTLYGKSRLFFNCLNHKCLAEITLDKDVITHKEFDKVINCNKCGSNYVVVKLIFKKKTFQMNVEPVEPPKGL